MVVVYGLERMTFEVLRLLRERGARVHCIVNSWGNERIVALAEEIGASWSIGRYWYGFGRQLLNPVKLMQFALDSLITSLGLVRDAWHFRPTYIFMPEFVSILRNVPALALLRCLGVLVVFEVANAPAIGPFYRRLWRWVVNPFVDQFVCNSSFTERELLACGIPARKVSYVYNCAPTRASPLVDCPHRDPGKIIYVGQIIPEKGIDLLLEAVSLVVLRGHDVRLDVVGEINGTVPPAYASFRERLLARAKQPDLAGRTKFLGWREDVPALLATAAIHCCPSRPEIREGFGLVSIEAKLAGLPSVVFPSGALPELIRHREDGWICSEVTAEGLAEGIEYFLDDRDRLERAGRTARASAARFSRGRFQDGWLQVFSVPK